MPALLRYSHTFVTKLSKYEGARFQSTKSARGLLRSHWAHLWAAAGLLPLSLILWGVTGSQLLLENTSKSWARGCGARVGMCPDLQLAPSSRSWWVLCQAGVLKPVVLAVEMVAQCLSQILRGFHQVKNAEGFDGIHSHEGWWFVTRELPNSSSPSRKPSSLTYTCQTSKWLNTICVLHNREEKDTVVVQHR